MNKTISKRGYGIIGIIVSVIAIMSVFVYFESHNNDGFTGNLILRSTHDLLTPTDKANNAINLNSTVSILVSVWIALILIGGYLLFHIHTKVLPKE